MNIFLHVRVATPRWTSAEVSILSNFAFCFVPIAVIGFVLMEKTKAPRTGHIKFRARPRGRPVPHLICSCKKAVQCQAIGHSCASLRQLRTVLVGGGNGPVATIFHQSPGMWQDVKHQLMISGCSSRAYWVSMLLWDRAWCELMRSSAERHEVYSGPR